MAITDTTLDVMELINGSKLVINQGSVVVGCNNRGQYQSFSSGVALNPTSGLIYSAETKLTTRFDSPTYY